MKKKEKNRASFLRLFWRRHLSLGACHQMLQSSHMKKPQQQLLLHHLGHRQGWAQPQIFFPFAERTSTISMITRSFLRLKTFLCHRVWRGGHWIQQTIIASQFFSLENQHPQHLRQEENREFYHSEIPIAFLNFENLHRLRHHQQELGNFDIPRRFLTEFLSFGDFQQNKQTYFQPWEFQLKPFC